MTGGMLFWIEAGTAQKLKENIMRIESSARLGLLWTLVVLVGSIAGEAADAKNNNKTPPPCKGCSLLVTSFKVGLERTKRGHGGGDTAWEEENLRSYKNSEVRLVEIQERLCSEPEVLNKDHCHNLANEHEALIEDWFTHKQSEHPDLHTFLCIEQLSVCCPKDTYGPNCEPCTDCKGNGKCKGAGTRKGNGKCLCDASYSGPNCNECSNKHYESFRDDSKLLCSPCHAACNDDGGCTGAGPKSCRKCKDGWLMDSENGCVDINECLERPASACRPQQFCVNNEGSFTCLECDRSCDGCDGDGPDMCRKCATGYQLKDGKCQEHDEGVENVMAGDEEDSPTMHKEL